MPQVQLNTRVDIDTYTKLKQFSDTTGRPIARITDEALTAYMAPPEMKKSKEIIHLLVVKGTPLVAYRSREQADKIAASQAAQVVPVELT